MQSSSSSTTMPPEPMMEPTVARVSKSTCMSRNWAGMQPPDGPPVWTALNCLSGFSMPPPMSKMISRSVMPMGTSMRPVFLILPVRAKTLVPLRLLACRSSIVIKPLGEDRGDIGKGLNVVQVRGHVPETAGRFGEPRRTGTRHAALALDGSHERRGLTAYECSGSFLDLEVEVESGAQDILAQEAHGPRLLDGNAEVLDRQGDIRAVHRDSRTARRWQRH